MKEFKYWFSDKISYQNDTIDRVAEQFMFKANVKEALINGDKRREQIVQTANLPKSSDIYKAKIKQRKELRSKIGQAKQFLYNKLTDY